MRAKVIRCVFTAGFLAVMLLAVAMSGEQEILFPEIFAVAVGAWICPRQPWRVSRLQLCLLMGAASAAGVLLVRFGPALLYLRILLGFFIAAGLLLLTGSTFVPVVSACILPVLLSTESWIYPAAVVVLSVLAAAGQWSLEKLGLREPERQPSRVFAARVSRRGLLHWGALLLCVAIFAAVPALTGQVYLIAPPLLVAFVELSHPESPARRRSVRILLLFGGAALLGTAVRLFLRETLGLPLVLCGLVAAVAMLLLFFSSDVFFPPVAAASFLPFLLPAEGLWKYPIELCLGGAVLFSAALLLFRERRAVPCPAAVQEPLSNKSGD